jgi:hypothetical protein
VSSFAERRSSEKHSFVMKYSMLSSVESVYSEDKPIDEETLSDKDSPFM